MIRSTPNCLLRRGPWALAKRAWTTAAAVWNRPWPAPVVAEAACDGAPDIEPPERLEFGLPRIGVLGSYELALLRAGLPTHVPGICNICGHDGGFPLRSDNFREDLVCPRCHASNRKRQVAAVVLAATGIGWCQTLARCAHALPPTVWVMETGPFAGAFRAENLIASRYLSAGYASGRVVRGVRHEDAMSPSFGDESLDLVVSCDVLEHVADPYLAHGQVFRCLKAGGLHVFTVPFLVDQARDEVRATLEDGEIRHHRPRVYHNDPDRLGGALVYRVFALEMLARLEEIGFEVTSALVHSLRFAILGANGVVFVARKPAIP